MGLNVRTFNSILFFFFFLGGGGGGGGGGVVLFCFQLMSFVLAQFLP
jgi:hypothetical protein